MDIKVLSLTIQKQKQIFHVYYNKHTLLFFPDYLYYMIHLIFFFFMIKRDTLYIM